MPLFRPSYKRTDRWAEAAAIGRSSFIGRATIMLADTLDLHGIAGAEIGDAGGIRGVMLHCNSQYQAQLTRMRVWQKVLPLAGIRSVVGRTPG